MENAENMPGYFSISRHNADVRQCVQITRLSRGDRQRIDEVLIALRKYGKYGG